MKSKISITLSEDVLAYIDRALPERGNRSDFIEKALRESIRRWTREARDRRDRQILDQHAQSLNREAEDALSYQVEL